MVMMMMMMMMTETLYWCTDGVFSTQHCDAIKRNVCEQNAGEIISPAFCSRTLRLFCRCSSKRQS